MTNKPPPQENLDRFRDRYATTQSETSFLIGREACGHDYGLSGYTTLTEARDLARYLPLGPESRLLDLGSGWGWPAIHFMNETDCNVVATDVPTQGLHEAADLLPLRAAADARDLPFLSGSFDAISHSDVFCWIPNKLSVLRECLRVLRPDGLAGGFVIHATAGLSESDELRAAELGPTAVSSSLPYPDLIREAGLNLTELIDVSEAFLRTIGKVLSSRKKHRWALLEDFGPEAYEEERERVERLREGVQTGVLSRSLFVAAKPG